MRAITNVVKNGRTVITIRPNYDKYIGEEESEELSEKQRICHDT